MTEQADSHAALERARAELKIALVEEVLRRRGVRLTPAGRSAISADSDLTQWTLVRVPTKYLKPISLWSRLILALADLTRVRRLRRLIPGRRRRTGRFGLRPKGPTA